MATVNRRMTLLGGLLASGCAAAASNHDNSQVPEFSLALQSRLPRQPPMLSLFRSEDRVLGFAAVHHAVRGDDPAFQTIRNAFADVSPEAVIIEGAQTTWGENPKFILSAANRLALSDDPFASGEALYTAQLAIKAGVPFWGGDPTDVEIYARLLAAGFDARDAFYAALFGPLRQSVRQDEVTGPTDPRFDGVFEDWAKSIAEDLPSPPDTSAAAFRAWYRERTGIELDADPSWLANHDPDHAGPVQAANKANMRIRDENLLEVITSRLESHRRVVVTYGGSHFATLYQPLIARFGRPLVR